MLRQPRRLLSAAIAIVLGVAFVAASLLIGDTFNKTLADAAAGTIGNATVVLTPARDASGVPITTSAVKAIEALPGVTEVRGSTEAQAHTGSGGVLAVRTLPTLSATTTVQSGRLPQASGEGALSVLAADALKKGVGDTVALNDIARGPRQVTIVGILTTGPDSVSSTNVGYLFAQDADVWAWSGLDGYTEVLVFGSGAEQTLADAVTALAPVAADHPVIRTATAERSARITRLANGSDALVVALLAFAAVAMFVSSQVIANTFSILVAQRARQLALLRCVGATKRQVFASVLGEAALLGLVASGLGVAAGLGLVALAVVASRGTQMELSGLAFSPTTLAAPVILGLLVTVVSALQPAVQATKVAPLAALRTGVVAASARPGLVRIAGGVLALAVGLPLLIAGARGWPDYKAGRLPVPANLAVGIGGGLISFLGAIALSALVIPTLARLLGPIAARLGGLPGQLASENAVRNPKRAAATASALLVGVTLITMMSVATESGKTTIMTKIDGFYPVDASVTPAGRTIDQPLATAVSGLKGVQRSVSVTSAPDARLTRTDGTGLDLSIIGLSPDDAGVARTEGFATGLADGVIMLPPGMKVDAGSTVSVAVSDADGNAGTPVSLRVVKASRNSTPVLVTPATMTRLTSTPTSVLWVRFSDDVDAYATAVALGEAASKASPDAVTEAAAIERQTLTSMLDIFLAIVVGLLGIAVVIALIGIGNTLSLSVMERTQESGLLRALGLTRSELRRSIGIEAILLAAVAVVLGLALGFGYGVAGIYALIGPQTAVVLDVPWARLGLAAGIALLAGWAASVLPAIRASKVPPAAALVEE